MAGVDPDFITGAGTGQSTLTSVPGGRDAPGTGPLGRLAVQPHHGLVAIVVFSVLVILVLDRAGFRFAVTVGRS